MKILSFHGSQKIVFLLAVVTGGAWAAPGAPDAARAIICPPPQKNLSYDAHEAAKRNLLTELGAASLSFKSKVEYALNRLGKKNPDRAALYGKWFQEFQNPAFTDFSSDDLVADQGSDVASVPAGCLLKPVIAQRFAVVPGDKTYLVDQKIWSTLSADNQAVLTLHAFIAREAAAYGEANAELVRYFNAIISSGEIGKMTYREFFDLIKVTGLRFMDTQDGVLVLAGAGSDDFYGNGFFRGVSVYEQYGGPSFLYDTPPHISLPGRLSAPYFVSYVAYYEDGNIKSASKFPNNASAVFTFKCPRVSGQIDVSEFSEMDFRDDGTVESLNSVLNLDLVSSGGQKTRYVKTAAGHEVQGEMGGSYYEGDPASAVLHFDQAGCPDLNGFKRQ